MFQYLCDSEGKPLLEEMNSRPSPKIVVEDSLQAALRDPELGAHPSYKQVTRSFNLEAQLSIHGGDIISGNM